MTRIALLTLFLAFTATSGNIARLKERTEAVDVDVPFARLGQEDGTRLAKLEPADEDPLPLLVELEPVEDEADDGADLDSYEEDVDESHPTPDVMGDEENGEVGDREKTGPASGRIQRRKEGRKAKIIKKTQGKNDGDMEKTDDVKLFSKLRPSEDEDEDLLEELDVSDDESTDNEEEELLVQSGGRHRFRQRLRQGGNRGANKRSRLSRRRSFMKLRTEKNNKARRFKKITKNNEDKMKKVHEADEDYEGRRHGRRNGAAKKNGGRHVKGGRRRGGAAGGCKKSSMICCDGSAPTWRRSPKGWHKKMTCKNGDKPVCFVDQCHYTVLDYFVSLI